MQKTENWTGIKLSGGVSSFLYLLMGIGSLLIAGFCSPVTQPALTHSYQGFVSLGYFLILISFFCVLSSADDADPQYLPVKPCVFGFLQLAAGAVLLLSVFPVTSIESFLFWSVIIVAFLVAGLNNTWIVVKHMWHSVPAALRATRLAKVTAKAIAKETREREEKEKIEKELISDLTNFLSNPK